MNKWQIVGIIGVVIVIIGMFLPWASVSYKDPDTGEKETATVSGYISILLWIFAILALVGAVIPKPIGGIIALVFGILGFLDALWNQIGIYGLKSVYENAGYTDIHIDVGVGGYIIMIGFIIAFIGGILQYVSLKKEAATPPPPPPPEVTEKSEENVETSQ